MKLRTAILTGALLASGCGRLAPEVLEPREERVPTVGTADRERVAEAHARYDAIIAAPKHEMARGQAAGREWILQAFDDTTDAVDGDGPAVGLAWRGFRLLRAPEQERAFAYTTHLVEGRSVLATGLVAESVSSVRFVADDGSTVDAAVHPFPKGLVADGLGGAFVIELGGKSGEIQALDQNGQVVDSESA